MFRLRMINHRILKMSPFDEKSHFIRSTGKNSDFSKVNALGLLLLFKLSVNHAVLPKNWTFGLVWYVFE